MAQYTKEFLVDAFVMRFVRGGICVDRCLALEAMANSFYDTVSRETFRSHCSLDAKAISEYKLWLES